MDLAGLFSRGCSGMKTLVLAVRLLFSVWDGESYVVSRRFSGRTSSGPRLYRRDMVTGTLQYSRFGFPGDRSNSLSAHLGTVSFAEVRLGRLHPSGTAGFVYTRFRPNGLHHSMCRCCHGSCHREGEVSMGSGKGTLQEVIVRCISTSDTHYVKLISCSFYAYLR